MNAPSNPHHTTENDAGDHTETRTAGLPISISISIDGKPVDAFEGEPLLTAAKRAGIDIPNLCYLEKCGPMTSCLACVVKVNGQDRLVPSCGTRVHPGMTVDSETDEIRAARRVAMELLFSDHVGDCLSPCHRLCPLHLNIPKMIRHIQAGTLTDAVAMVREDLALASVLGRLCSHPCENGCRRSAFDHPAAIRDMERHVAEVDFASNQPHTPIRANPSGKTVVVIGSGPAGLAVAYYLQLMGHQCTVRMRGERLGGTLRSAADQGAVPHEIIDAELDLIRRIGCTLQTDQELGRDFAVSDLTDGFDAVVLATGAPEDETPARPEHEPDAVFHVGRSVKPIKHIVRAIADAKITAHAVSGFLASGTRPAPGLEDKAFSCGMGRIAPDEMKLFLESASARDRIIPGNEASEGLTPGEAVHEAERCLHCDCRAADFCRLRGDSSRYGVDANHYRHGGTRRSFEQFRQAGGVLFEPGKCIDCGICVRLTEMAGEPLGLTYIGRGFDVKIGTPLDKTIDEGLTIAADECIRCCPTGALSR